MEYTQQRCFYFCSNRSHHQVAIQNRLFRPEKNPGGFPEHFSLKPMLLYTLQYSNMGLEISCQKLDLSNNSTQKHSQSNKGYKRPRKRSAEIQPQSAVCIGCFRLRFPHSSGSNSDSKLRSISLRYPQDPRDPRYLNKQSDLLIPDISPRGQNISSL